MNKEEEVKREREKDIWLDEHNLHTYEEYLYAAVPRMTEIEYWWLVEKHLERYFTEEGL